MKKSLAHITAFTAVAVGGAINVVAQTIDNPLGSGATFTTIICRFTDWGMALGVPLMALMAMIGAYIYLTSGGGDRVKLGARTLTYAGIGLAILLAAKGIAVLIRNVLGGTGGSSC